MEPVKSSVTYLTETIMGHPKHLDGSVDKSEDFIAQGMTLITEIDSEKYLKMSEQRKKEEAKRQELRDRWAE